MFISLTKKDNDNLTQSSTLTMNPIRFLSLSLIFYLLSVPLTLHAKEKLHPIKINSHKVSPGIEQLFTKKYFHLIKRKNIGLITNHTAVTPDLIPSSEVLRKNQKKGGYRLVAFFSPEHGIDGADHSEEKTCDSTHQEKIPIYSLHGSRRRPTQEMLKNIDLLIYDIQDIGSRSYTYISTLFYMMEAAAKNRIPILILDRPNPINGITIDGPMLDPKLRSFVGYINVPYCHGMTVGELARYFNSEYNINCQLTVVPMKGWKREMSFEQTGLPWIPTSPHIPEPATTLYYPTTGILGEISLVNIGIGYTLPFKLVGAPWIDGNLLAKKLNQQKLPGVYFQPFHYKPFYGSYAKKKCQGVLIVVSDFKTFKPVSTQYLILGILKSLYPERFKNALTKSKKRKEMFDKVNGTTKVWDIMENEKYIAYKLMEIDSEKRKSFAKKRENYLLY